MCVSIFQPQMTQITRILKGLRPVTSSMVEGSHVAHTQYYMRCLDYARHDKREKISVSLCLRV